MGSVGWGPWHPTQLEDLRLGEGFKDGHVEEGRGGEAEDTLEGCSK